LNLYKVQIAALQNSAGAAGFAYFMEQGLGKTLTSFADFLERVAEGNTTRMIVVCPNSFKQGWVEDAEKHGVDLDFFIWTAGNAPYLRSWVKRGFKKPPCLIINWEAIRAKKVKVGKEHRWMVSEFCQMIIDEYIADKDVFIVFDESILAKTHNSAQTIGGIHLSKECRYSRILSGKPITQGPHDLWGQMRLAKQFSGKDFFSFKNAFCKMGGFKMKQVIGAMNEDILAELIEPYIFRATKADWTDLPPKSWTIREYTMTPEMKTMYDQMEQEFVLWLQSGDHVTVDAAITKYIKLAQIQCGWVYDEDQKIHQLVSNDRNPRLKALLDFIEMELTGKMAVVYHHKPVFKQLVEALGESNCAWIKGGMEPSEIEAQKAAFNTDPNIRFILLQDNASKYGHTLLGIQDDISTACHTMGFYENNYSLDTRSQIEDRPHRHGQDYPVSYVDFVGTSLDRNCVRALQRKESVFQAVFSHLGRPSK
jgi:hypothetical protein